MSWTIPPDSLRVTVRDADGPGDRLPSIRTRQGPREVDVLLVEGAQAYLDCLARGNIPRPALVSAWDEFYRTYAPLVVRVVRCRSGRAFDPDDLAQDVWQTILIRLAAFRPDPVQGSFRSWLLIVVRHRVADRIRSDLRKSRPTTWDNPPDHFESAEYDPAVSLERSEERAIFESLLVQLRTQVTPLNYRVLQMRTLENRAVPEVARLVGLTTDQVRIRHHRTVAKLRQLAGQAEGRDSETTSRISKKLPLAAQQRSAT